MSNICAFEWIIHCNTQCLTIEVGLTRTLLYATLQQKALYIYVDYFLYWSFHSTSLILINSFDTKFCVILRGSLWMYLLIDLQQSHLSISKKLFFPLLTCHIRFVSIPSPNSGDTGTLLVAKHRITMYVSMQTVPSLSNCARYCFARRSRFSWAVSTSFSTSSSYTSSSLSLGMRRSLLREKIWDRIHSSEK